MLGPSIFVGNYVLYIRPSTLSVFKFFTNDPPLSPNLVPPYNFQFSDILPSFDFCSSVFKNAKCKAKCPGNTYARNKNNVASSILTKCSCQGQNCLWAVGKTIKPDLFCISEYRWSFLTDWSFLGHSLSWPSILQFKVWTKTVHILSKPSTFMTVYFEPSPSTLNQDRPFSTNSLSLKSIYRDRPRLLSWTVRLDPIGPSIFASTLYVRF